MDPICIKNTVTGVPLSSFLADPSFSQKNVNKQLNKNPNIYQVQHKAQESLESLTYGAFPHN